MGKFISTLLGRKIWTGWEVAFVIFAPSDWFMDVAWWIGLPIWIVAFLIWQFIGRAIFGPGDRQKEMRRVFEGLLEANKLLIVYLQEQRVPARADLFEFVNERTKEASEFAGIINEDQKHGRAV